MKSGLIAVTFTLGLLSAVPSTAATTITSSAYALYSDIDVANTTGAVIGPLAAASGVASPGYTVNNAVLSLDAIVDFGLVAAVSAGLHLTNGLATSAITANGTYAGDTTVGSGHSQINGLGVNLFTKAPLLPSLTTLGLTADTINSTTTVTRLGNSVLFTGTSVFKNLHLELRSLLNFGLAANAQVLPNTVLIDQLGIRIVLNEQIVGGNGDTSQALTTNAINIRLNNYLLGGRSLTGNLIVGNSYASIDIDDAIIPTPGVPEPAVWLQLIAGFGLTGAVLRRRKPVIA